MFVSIWRPEEGLNAMSAHDIAGFFIFHHVIGDSWKRKEIKWLRAHRFL